MNREPYVFVDVDTQRDFLEPGGSLYLEGSEPILENLRALTRLAIEKGIPILATACAHTLDEPDPEPFPPHCLVGSRGAERIEETAVEETVALGPDGRLEAVLPEPGSPPRHLTLQKRRYDLFSHPEADRVVELYATAKPTFVVYGVATDYCVSDAVRGLRRRGHPVILVRDAIYPVDRASESNYLDEFERLGVRMEWTAEVIETLRNTPRTSI